MNDITIRFVFDNKNVTGHRKKEKGKTYKDTGLLQIEAKQAKTTKRVFITTNIKLRPDQVSDKNGFTCKNHPNATLITAKAHRLYREIEAFTLSDKCQNLADVKNWDKDETSTTSIKDFIIAELKRRNPSMGVIEYNKSFLTRLEEFGKIITFADLNYQNIVDFDTFLRRTIKTQTTLYKRHNLFKSYINEAIKRGLCNANPYDLFKITKGKAPVKEYLTEEEIRKIQAYNPDTDKLQKVKDLFIFQCYTGMAYIDIMKFGKDSVMLESGVKVIRSSRTKTDESYILPLFHEAEMIAEWYDYQLPKISNQRYNDYIKVIMAYAGITKNVTTHTARHTFATLLLNKGVPIETVSRALGHANIKQTQHYAKMLGKKVIDDLKDIL